MPDPAQRVSEVPLRRNGCHQYGGRSIVPLQVLLHDKTAHGVTDDHRCVGQAVGNRADILDIVGDRTGPQWLVSRAVSMTAEAQRQSTITLVGKEAEEIFIPAP